MINRGKAVAKATHKWGVLRQRDKTIRDRIFMRIQDIPRCHIVSPNVFSKSTLK